MEMNLANTAVVNKVMNMKAKEDWICFTGVPEDKTEHDAEWTEGQLVTIASASQKSKRERFSVLKPTVLPIKFWCPKAAGLGDSSGNVGVMMYLLWKMYLFWKAPELRIW